MNAKTIIKRALRKINAYDVNQEPTSKQFDNCLEEMNAMLALWEANDILVMHSTQENFSISSGTATYSIGDGGDFDTIRPEMVMSAFIRESTQDYPLDIVTDEVYRAINLKGTTGRPTLLNYHPTFPLGYINFYYTPDSSYTVYMDNLSKLADITSLTDDFTLSPIYEDAIVYNLALRIAPEYERKPSAVVVGMADLTYRNLQSINLAKRIRPVDLEVGQMTLINPYEDLSQC